MISSLAEISGGIFMAERCLEASSWQPEPLSLGLTGTSKGDAILEVQSSENRRNNVFWMNVSLLIILLHEALQRRRGERGVPALVPAMHRHPVAHVQAKERRKTSLQGKKVPFKIICSRGKECISNAGLVAVLFPRGKSLLFPGWGNGRALATLVGSEPGCLLLPVPPPCQG